MDRRPVRAAATAAATPAARATSRRALVLVVVAVALLLLPAHLAFAHGPHPYVVWLFGRPAAEPAVAASAAFDAAGEEAVPGDGVTVYGALVGPGDEPAVGGRVRLHPPPGPEGGNRPATEWVEVDAEGRFEIAGLQPGPFTVKAVAPGYAALPAHTLEVPPAQDGGKIGRHNLGTFRMRREARVSGRVVDAAGAPVSGATIRASGTSAGEAHPRSDAAGRFSVGGFAPGDHLSLGVAAEGYAAAFLSDVSAPEPDLVIVLQRPASVAGVVVDPDGRPVAGAWVTRQRVYTGRPQWTRGPLAPPVRSDEEGRFELLDVPPGRVVVATTDSRVELSLAAGERRQGLRLAVLPTATLHGRVTDGQGNAVVGATVRAWERSSPQSGHGSSRQTGEDGSYELRVRRGPPLEVTAWGDGWVPETRSARVDGEELRFDFQLQPGGAEVHGRVEDADGNPLAGAQVRVQPLSGSEAGLHFAFVEITTSEDGGFTTPKLFPGTYDLAASHGFRVAVTAEPVTVEDAPVEGVVLVLPDVATLVGEVRGVAADERQRVSVAAEPLHAALSTRTTPLDADGTYRLPGIGPGRWRVSAGSSSAWGTGREVTVYEGDDEVRVDLELAAGATVDGVVSINGVPAADQPLSLGGDGRATTVSDHRGRFRFTAVPPGSHELRVDTWGYRRSLRVDGDRKVTVEIATSRVAGRVVDAAGTPLGDVKLALQPAAEPPAETPPGQPVEPPSFTVYTDSAGAFRIEVPAGETLLRAARAGFMPAERALFLLPGSVQEGIEIELRRGVALLLDLGADPAPPPWVSVALLDAAGAVRSWQLLYADDGDRVEVPGLPIGPLRLLVSAQGRATLALRLETPSPPVPVALPPECRLEIRVAELEGTATAASARLRDAAGEPFRLLLSSRAADRWTLLHGQATVVGLPPGAWSVEATAEDGRTWAGEAIASRGAAASVTLLPTTTRRTAATSNAADPPSPQ